MDNARTVVLVSGASSGIGRATAERLAQNNFHVFAGVRRPPSASFGSAVVPITLDVTDEDSVREAVQAVLAQAGRIDVLVNNAGISLIGAIEETTTAQASAVLDTNFLGVLRLTRAVLPAMREQGQGRIINVSSIAGISPGPFMGIYSASKHALEALSEVLDQEVRIFGVRVAVIEPGFVRTHIDASARRAEAHVQAYEPQRERVAGGFGEQVDRAQDPAKVAEVIEHAIRAPGFRRYLVGRDAKLAFRLRTWLPRAIFDKLVRMSFRLDS